MLSYQTLSRTLRGVVTLARDPSRLDQVFVIGEAVEGQGLLGRVAARQRAAHPEVDRLVAERYSPPLADLAALARLPEGTLGRTFADNMLAHGYQVDFFPHTPVTDDGKYLLDRLRRTHDIWHAVTGFATDAAGELGLQAFYLAQTGSPLAVLLIGTAMLRSLAHPQDLRLLMPQLRRGYTLGRRCRSFLAQRWEDGWERPLVEWRAAVGMVEA